MCYIYYTHKIRHGGQQHPIRHVRQHQKADWRENWTTPWKAKCLANTWEAFLIPGSSNFTDNAPVLQWWKRDLVWFSCKRAATSRGRNHSPWTPNPKGERVCICVPLPLLAALMVQESLRSTFRIPIGVSNAGVYTEWMSSINYCKRHFVDSESRVLQHYTRGELNCSLHSSSKLTESQWLAGVSIGRGLNTYYRTTDTVFTWMTKDIVQDRISIWWTKHRRNAKRGNS